MKTKEKLRTLKDIENNLIGVKHSEVFPKIKAEAIKWVKEVRGIFIENDGKLNIAYGIETAMAIGWIKHFFNLTESDLEDKDVM